MTGVVGRVRAHLPVDMSLAGAGVSDVLASWDGQAEDVEEERVMDTVVNTHALAQDVRAATPTSVRPPPPARTTFWEAFPRPPRTVTWSCVLPHTTPIPTFSHNACGTRPTPTAPTAFARWALPQVGSTDALRERLYAKDLALRTLLATQSPIVSPRGSTRSSPAASPAASPQKPPLAASAAKLRSRSPLGSPAKALTDGAHTHTHTHTTPPCDAASAAVTSSVESPPSSPRLDAVRRRRPHSKHMQEYLNRMERLLAEVQTAHGQTGRPRPAFAAVGARLSKSVASARRTAYASHVRSSAEDDSRWVDCASFPFSARVFDEGEARKGSGGLRCRRH